MTTSFQFARRKNMKNEAIGKPSSVNLTDWAKVSELKDDEIICDADSPATTEADWADAFVCRGAEELHNEAVRRTRGKNKSPTKEQVVIRYDADILAHFRATGKGWQTRMNDALKEWVKEHSA
jgi:uncharacterized protein (DUF4415 family)